MIGRYKIIQHRHTDDKAINRRTAQEMIYPGHAITIVTEIRESIVKTDTRTVSEIAKLQSLAKTDKKVTLNYIENHQQERSAQH